MRLVIVLLVAATALAGCEAASGPPDAPPEPGTITAHLNGRLDVTGRTSWH